MNDSPPELSRRGKNRRHGLAVAMHQNPIINLDRLGLHSKIAEQIEAELKQRGRIAFELATNRFRQVETVDLREFISRTVLSASEALGGVENAGRRPA